MKQDFPVLVTGATGFFGRHLSSRLINEGMEVVGISRHKISLPGMLMIQADICDINQLAEAVRLKPFKVIFHLASFRPPKSEPIESLSQLIKVNILGTLNLLSLMDSSATRFVYASSLSVCNGRNWGRPVTEEDMAPKDVYSASKLNGEHLTRSICEQRAASHIALRYSSIYGPGDTHSFAVPKLIQDARKGKELIIFGQGLRMMDLVYIEDVIRITLKAGFSGAQGVFNIGQGVGTKVADLVYAIADVFGNGRCLVRHEAVKSEDRLELVADLSKSEKILNYSPEYNLTDGLAHYLKMLDESYIHQ